MKIVQSLWTKKGHKGGTRNFSTTHRCGWPDKKYNYFSWALSALQLRKYYDQLELVTDEKGYELLIKKMQLPYTSVKVVLDNLSRYHDELMMLGKIYAYSIQEAPFIHVDADVFIWRPFDEGLFRSPLICQSPEDGTFYNKHYGDIFYPMLRNLAYCPEVLEASVLRNNCIRTINAGIIGGTDTAFFREYARMVFEFVDRNLEHLHKIDVNYANIVFEQFLFSALAEDRQLEIKFFSPNAEVFLSDIVDLTGVPGRRQYIHLYAGH